ncbi:hypothetical protein D049_1390B, partial [Vibrio parahaemolyticus VPTS-2010]
LPVL